MANPFSITAATETIPLDAQGRGSTTFTVSNISGQLRRGRARLVPADPGQASWLSVEGDAERNFAVGGTQQYTVRVAVPSGAPPGRHTFGLDVVSVENPDEEWSQGPKVAFEVPATPPPKKPFPWWILIVILGLLLVGGLVAWLATRNGEPEPAGLLAECKQEADCAEGLTCVTDKPGQPGLCRGKPGFKSCRRDFDCQDGLVCADQVCRASEGTKRCYVAVVTVNANTFPHRACFTYKPGQPDCEAEYRFLGDPTQPPYDTTVHACTQHQAKFRGSHADGYWFEMAVDFDTLTGEFHDSVNQQGKFKLSPE